ncbi:hypothetical protein C9374_005181 [Naegleria lovaniensis]|uniref:Uncharacterized protein n=1 Tax=Naegleria lovaniensis TaxID=51637 RepID=A0AA88GNY1_NAELO|nr:uncharacterized protein C9374_005181 [Naegleria lovaniensis]KAG2382601.1 hypothetical protein C9374_005181 [Naegleria lovaniensis]
MRFIASLVILALIASVAYAQTQHCISKAFITSSVVVDASKAFDDIERVWFDATTNKQRTDVEAFSPVRRSVSLYFRHDLQKGYEYNKITGECRSFPIGGTLQPFCLAQNAVLNGTVTIGGSLKCTVWNENLRGFNVRLVLAPNPSFGIPVNVITKGGRVGTAFQEFFNFQAYNTLQDQSVFDIPTSCNRATRSAAEVSELALDVMERHAWLN